MTDLTVKRISVVAKESGKAAEKRRVTNSEAPLKRLIGGEMEIVPFSYEGGWLCVICNKEARINGSEENITFLGVTFYGTVFFSFVENEQFTGLTKAATDMVLKEFGC